MNAVAASSVNASCQMRSPRAPRLVAKIRKTSAGMVDRTINVQRSGGVRVSWRSKEVVAMICSPAMPSTARPSTDTMVSPVAAEVVSA